MADNQRQDDILELTEEMASTAEETVGSTAIIPEVGESRAGSAPPPQARSPFQPLVDPASRPPEDNPISNALHVPDPRPSFVPKPSTEPVHLSPIQRVVGKTKSMPPPRITQPPPQPIRERFTEAASRAETAPEAVAAAEGGAPSVNGSSSALEGAGTSRRPPLPKAPPDQVTDKHARPVESKPPPTPGKRAAISMPPPGLDQDVQTDGVAAAALIDTVTGDAGAAHGVSASHQEMASGATQEDIEEMPSDVLEEEPEEILTQEIQMVDMPDVPESGASMREGGDVDQGSPEAVFDAPSGPGTRVDKITGEIDLSEAEELDPSQVPKMPKKAPPAPPVALAGVRSEGRKPKIRKKQKKNKDWWARIFNDDYVSTMPKATVKGDQRKVNFIEKSLGVPSNALVLDLACGNGRHSVGMAKKGYRMVGIDLSLPMLAQAAELAQEEHQNINFIHGDMRDLSFDKTFDSVFCMGTSFGYFSEEENIKVLMGVFRGLKPGGMFLLEVANRDHVITQTPDLTWFEGNGSICMEESHFDFFASRLHVTRQLIMDGGRQVENKISIRLYTLHEIMHLFKTIGFNIGQISGHMATTGAFFGPDSVRIFITGQRPL